MAGTPKTNAKMEFYITGTLFNFPKSNLKMQTLRGSLRSEVKFMLKSQYEVFRLFRRKVTFSPSQLFNFGILLIYVFPYTEQYSIRNIDEKLHIQLSTQRHLFNQ